jgi:hypothetical protein
LIKRFHFAFLINTECSPFADGASFDSPGQHPTSAQNATATAIAKASSTAFTIMRVERVIFTTQ